MVEKGSPVPDEIDGNVKHKAELSFLPLPWTFEKCKIVMLGNLNKLIIPFLISATVLWHYGQAKDFYTSTAGLEDLFKTELQLTAEMQNYIDTLSQHIEMLQR